VTAKPWNTPVPRPRRPRRLAILLGPVAVAGVGILVWTLTASEAGKASAPAAATATRGDLTVSVGGVGRVVEANAPVQPTAAGGSTTVAGRSSTAGPSSAPTGSVFPLTTGRVSRLLVAAGQHVSADQVVAVLDDGGTAAAAVAQAEDELALAEVELRQKQALQTTDVSGATLDAARARAELEALRGGTPAAHRRAVEIARQSIQLAERRLHRLLSPPPYTRAETSAADADVKKAEADLAALLTSPAPPLPETIAAAQKAVATAQQKLTRVTGPADPAAVTAADATLKRAQADLGLLIYRDPPPTVAELAAARAAVQAAEVALAKVQAPADPADVATAELEVDRALADLATLLKPPLTPSQEAVAAATQAVAAARAKRAGLRSAPPPNPADVTAARVDLARAKADLRAVRAGPSPQALAAVHQAIETSQTKLTHLQSSLDLEVAKLKIAAARSKLASARIAERLLTVRATRAGTVTSLLAVRGIPVDATTPLLTVADLQHLAAQVDLSEFDVARVKPGQKAVVRVDALGGKPYPGKVAYAAPTGYDNNGVVTFPVRIGLGGNAGLRAGMNVSVKIVVAQRDDVVMVPLEAVSQDDEDRTVVEVLDASGQPVTKPVTTGLASNDSVEIVKGLKAGQRVVLPESEPAGEEP
jgi:HlyD family secretion protein